MTQSNRELIGLLAQHAYKWSPEKSFELAAGGKSQEYLDCKRALSHPETMATLGPLVCSMLRPSIVAIGGLTMGADPIAMSAAQSSAVMDHHVRWFSVRKEAKAHGLHKLIEGSVEAGDHVAVVDDVVTSGMSTIKAIKACQEARLIVVQVIVLVDREQSDGMKKIREAAGRDCAVDAICTKSEIAMEWRRQQEMNALRATA